MVSPTNTIFSTGGAEAPIDSVFGFCSGRGGGKSNTDSGSQANAHTSKPQKRSPELNHKHFQFLLDKEVLQQQQESNRRGAAYRK